MTPAFYRHYASFVFSWEIVGRNKSLMHLSEKVCGNNLYSDEYRNMFSTYGIVHFGHIYCSYRAQRVLIGDFPHTNMQIFVRLCGTEPSRKMSRRHKAV